MPSVGKNGLRNIQDRELKTYVVTEPVAVQFPFDGGLCFEAVLDSLKVGLQADRCASNEMLLDSGDYSN